MTEEERKGKERRGNYKNEGHNPDKLVLGLKPGEMTSVARN
jgi:hypothetical protein